MNPEKGDAMAASAGSISPVALSLVASGMSTPSSDSDLDRDS